MPPVLPSIAPSVRKPDHEPPMNPAERTAKEEALRALLADFKLPPVRVHRLDLRWLNRNISANNGNHPKLAEALTLLRDLLRDNVTKDS